MRHFKDQDGCVHFAGPKHFDVALCGHNADDVTSCIEPVNCPDCIEVVESVRTGICNEEIVPPKPKLPIDNMPPEGFIIGISGDEITIGLLGMRLTKDKALNLAAWLVALADPIGERFEEFLEAVRNT